MSITGNTIYAPVRISEVKQMLGTEGDLAALCKSGAVNRWSRSKPIRYTKLNPLTTTSGVNDQRRGNSADQSNGIVWGLRARPNVQYYQGLHNCDYSYEGKPSGEIYEPYRLSDFDRYCHTAQMDVYGVPYVPATVQGAVTFTLSLSISGEAYDSQSPHLFLEDFRQDNTSSLTYLDYYVCVMVDNYVHACYNTYIYNQTGQLRVTKIKDSGVQYIDFMIPTNDLPASARSSGRHVATFFLAQRVSDATLMINFTEWTDITGMLRQGNDVVGVPSAVNLAFIVDNSWGAGSLYPRLGINQIAVTASFFGECETMQEYRFTATVSVSTGSATKTLSTEMVKPAGTTSYEALIWLISWSQLGFVSPPQSGIAKVTCSYQGHQIAQYETNFEI